MNAATLRQAADRLCIDVHVQAVSPERQRIDIVEPGQRSFHRPQNSQSLRSVVATGTCPEVAANVVPLCSASNLHPSSRVRVPRQFKAWANWEHPQNLPPARAVRTVILALHLGHGTATVCRSRGAVAADIDTGTGGRSY